MENSERPTTPETDAQGSEVKKNPRSWRHSAFVRQAIFLFIVLPLVIAANLAVWAALNRPYEPEAWTGEIVGLSYSPYRQGQDPTQSRHPTMDQIDEDLKLLAGSVQAIRTYSMVFGQQHIPELAAKHGLSVAAGAWIGPNLERNEIELERLIQAAPRRNVVRVLVGNEALTSSPSISSPIGKASRSRRR